MGRLKARALARHPHHHHLVDSRVNWSTLGTHSFKPRSKAARLSVEQRRALIFSRPNLGDIQWRYRERASACPAPREKPGPHPPPGNDPPFVGSPPKGHSPPVAGWQGVAPWSLVPRRARGRARGRACVCVWGWGLHLRTVGARPAAGPRSCGRPTPAGRTPLCAGTRAWKEGRKTRRPDSSSPAMCSSSPAGLCRLADGSGSAAGSTAGA